LILQKNNYTCIGGQAVIEGVMMRSPHFMATAVRRTVEGSIVIKEVPWRSLSDRVPFLKKPFFRGVVSLFESLAGGMRSLSFSADEAAAQDALASEKKSKNTDVGSENKKGLSTLEVAASMTVAFGFGMALFVALPHLATHFLGQWGLFDSSIDSAAFHLVDGIIKTMVLVLYILAISLMPDIRRVFQYHGAEHKSIYAFENGDDLTVANARKYPTMHPRCGTSFLLFLVVVSVFVFSAIFPLIVSAMGVAQPKNLGIGAHFLAVFFKIVLMVPIASVSYEIIRFSGNHMQNPIVRFLISPGLLLQKLTTREPTDDQLEVALASLRRVLYLEKQSSAPQSGLVVIQELGDIPTVNANAMEFQG
jgi:uncharacterized protein YqhQ